MSSAGTLLEAVVKRNHEDALSKRKPRPLLRWAGLTLAYIPLPCQVKSEPAFVSGTFLCRYRSSSCGSRPDRKSPTRRLLPERYTVHASSCRPPRTGQPDKTPCNPGSLTTRRPE